MTRRQITAIAVGSLYFIGIALVGVAIVMRLYLDGPFDPNRARSLDILGAGCFCFMTGVVLSRIAGMTR